MNGQRIKVRGIVRAVTLSAMGVLLPAAIASAGSSTPQGYVETMSGECSAGACGSCTTFFGAPGHWSSGACRSCW